MNLLTGKLISRHKVTPIPITKEVIDRVVALAKKDGIKSPMNFNDRKERTIREDYWQKVLRQWFDYEYEEEYEPTEEEDIIYDK